MSRIADSHTVLPSMARSGTTISASQVNTRFNAMHLIVNVTDLGAGPPEQLFVVIQGRDPASSNDWYNIVNTGISFPISTLGPTVIRVGAGMVPSDRIYNDFIPAMWRLIVPHLGATTMTYSVGVNYTNG